MRKIANDMQPMERIQNERDREEREKESCLTYTILCYMYFLCVRKRFLFYVHNIRFNI